MAKIRILMKYQGGKSKLSRKIISKFPKHKYYVEPFAGALGMFINKPPAYSEIINDLNDNLFNLYLQIQTNYQEIISRMNYLLISRTQWKFFVKEYENLDNIDKAIAMLYIYSYSFGGKGVSGGFSSVWRKRIVPLTDIKNRLKFISKRLERVTIENQDYKNIIKKYDTKDTLFYFDPPYINTEIGGYNNNGIDHTELINIALNIKGKAVISHLDNELYNSSKLNKIPIVEKLDQINKTKINKECIYTNFKEQGRLF